METKNLSDNFGVTFIVCAFCYWVINFLLLSQNHIISYPVQGDDYHAFIFTFNLKIWHTNRPIFYFLAPLFADLGRVGYYLFMHVMVVLCAVTVFRFGRKLFSFALPIEWIIFYAVVVFSFPFIIDVSKFLGAIINLCSALFALISMLSLLKGSRENKNSFFIVAAIFFTLSIFTKEDFILPNILLVFYLLFLDKKEKNQKASDKKLYFYLGYSIIAVLALVLFNKYIAHSVFTGMSVVPSVNYEINMTFSSIFHVLIKYLTPTFYTTWFSISILVISGLCMLFTNTQIKIKILFCILSILSLILPYTVLPNHFSDFYSYNWLPWEGILIVFGLFTLTSFLPRIVKCAFILIVSILLNLSTHAYRNGTSSFYDAEATVNKNMISTLMHYKNQLNQEDYIGVSGVTGLSPWADGVYLENLGLKPKWIIFVDKSSVFNTINGNNKLNPGIRINVLNTNQRCDFPHMKYIYFTPDGKGKLSDNCRNAD